MKNRLFDVTVDRDTGYLSSIRRVDDPFEMNWCASDGCWGKLHGRKFELVSCSVDEKCAVCEYSDGKLSACVKRTFLDNDNFAEQWEIRNLTDTVIFINRDNFGVELPFNDRYTNADECMIHHCHAHIWCGHHITWVNALKMGDSECNLGLVLTAGAMDCYSQLGCKSNHRGVFVFHPESVMLNAGASYIFSWELFGHTGTEDFMQQLSAYPHMIDVSASHYTLFMGESADISIKCAGVPEVFCGEQRLDVQEREGIYHALFVPCTAGEYRLKVRVGAVATWADLMVKIPFAELLEKRVKFIVRNQQCMDPQSPLYGAFLVYDNEYDSMYFDFFNPDHNACRERLNIAFLLIKYLQIREDAEVRAAVERFIPFVFREFFEAETGEVFNTIGKKRDQLRLYNAPGVMLLFAELYYLTKDEAYLNHILKLAENYYGIGGKKCYANGLAIKKVMKAFSMAGRMQDGERMMEYFHSHVDNIIGNGTSYPKHEVNYEQTIVTPAVTHISEMGQLCENKEDYIREANKHIRCLERFNGHQPSFHLYEISLRYWDGFWFGKRKTFGDTLPHHLSCLTARSYVAYSQLTGDRSWLARAEECLRNCMCLVGDDARGASAYLYPYMLDDRRGEYYDPWSNDQDLIFYDALYLKDELDCFKFE